MSNPKESFLSSGHQITLKVGGKEVGAARGIEIHQDFGIEPAYVIGTTLPMEHVPQRWNGTLDLDKFYIRKELGSGANFDVSSEGVLTVNAVDIEIIDKDSGETILVAQGCTLTSSSISIAANAFTGEKASLTALRIVRKEIGTPILNNGV